MLAVFSPPDGSSLAAIEFSVRVKPDSVVVCGACGRLTADSRSAERICSCLEQCLVDRTCLAGGASQGGPYSCRPSPIYNTTVPLSLLRLVYSVSITDGQFHTLDGRSMAQLSAEFSSVGRCDLRVLPGRVANSPRIRHTHVCRAGDAILPHLLLGE